MSKENEFTKEENDEYLSGTEEPMGELGDDQLDGIAGGVGGRLDGRGGNSDTGSGRPVLPPVTCQSCGRTFPHQAALATHVCRVRVRR